MSALKDTPTKLELLDRAVVDFGDARGDANTVTNIDFAGHNLQIRDGHLRVIRPPVNTALPGDYGCDPLPDGTFRMVPSGDIVSYEESRARLKERARRQGEVTQ